MILKYITAHGPRVLDVMAALHKQIEEHVLSGGDARDLVIDQRGRNNMISREQAQRVLEILPQISDMEAEMAETILRLYEFVDEIDDIHNHWDSGRGPGEARHEIWQALFALRYGPDPREET